MLKSYPIIQIPEQYLDVVDDIHSVQLNYDSVFIDFRGDCVTCVAFFHVVIVITRI